MYSPISVLACTHFAATRPSALLIEAPGRMYAGSLSAIYRKTATNPPTSEFYCSSVTRSIAIISSGLIGKTHATVLRALIDGGLIDARLHAACDLDVQRAASMQDIFGFARGTTILDEALDGADVVYVCTPTDAHASIVEAACARGQALFCEKPLAHTAPDAQYMADAVQKAGVPAQVGLVLRYSPIFGEMRAMINGAEPVMDPGRKMAAVFRDDQCFPVGGGYGSQ